LVIRKLYILWASANSLERVNSSDKSRQCN